MRTRRSCRPARCWGIALIQGERSPRGFEGRDRLRSDASRARAAPPPARRRRPATGPTIEIYGRDGSFGTDSASRSILGALDDLGGKAIAATGDGRDVFSALRVAVQRPSDHENLLAQIRFLDEGLRPQRAEQLFLRQDARPCAGRAAPAGRTPWGSATEERRRGAGSASRGPAETARTQMPPWADFSCL